MIVTAQSNENLDENNGAANYITMNSAYDSLIGSFHIIIPSCRNLMKYKSHANIPSRKDSFQKSVTKKKIKWTNIFRL